MSYRAKRLLDLAVAGPALVLLVVAGLVAWRLGRPVLFRQDRPGLGGRLFTLYKFRTMTDARDAAGRRLPDGERLTRLGRVPRGLSLDELPELLNVLRGEMRLVGPRDEPGVPEYAGGQPVTAAAIRGDGHVGGAERHSLRPAHADGGYTVIHET